MGHLHATGEKSKSEVEKKLKQRVRRSEAERKAEKKKLEEKLSSKRNRLAQEKEKVSIAEKHLEKLKKDIRKLKKTNEKLVKEKDDELKEKEDEHKEERSKDRKQIKSLKLKNDALKQEKEKLESKISSISICGDPVPGPSTGGDGLFQVKFYFISLNDDNICVQEMLDNFRELAETQLQCAVCSEVFVEATSINCGHTFCHYCIYEWKKKKSNCPVCRTDIKQIVQCKVLDAYADHMYEQFVSEGGKLARASLKEERMKIKKDAEEAAAARSQERRARAERRRVDREASDDEDDNHDGPLEMVNLVMNRINRSRRILDDAEESVDSDATLELHLSDGDLPSDTDSEVDIVQRIGRRHRIILRDSDNSDIFDTDSDDDDFRARDQNRDNDDNDTDSLTDSTESNSSQSSSDSSSDSESD